MEFLSMLIHVIMFGLGAEIVQSDFWFAIDEYVYPVLVLAGVIYIFRKSGWNGLRLAGKAVIGVSLLLTLMWSGAFVLSGIIMLFISDSPSLVIFVESNSIWPSFLLYLCMIEILVLIGKLVFKFDWEK